MTWATEKIKNSSKKIVLFEIDIPTKGGELDVLLNYEAGIWFTSLAPGEVIPEDDYGVFGYYDNTTEDDGLDVGSVIVKDISYVKVESIDELRIQSESFYYDEDTTKLYIHFDAWHKPVNYRWIDYITIGAVTGFCDSVDSTNGCYYDDIYYAPRIISIPSINKKKDKLFYGFISFSGGNVVLENSDGYFDDYRSLNIYNQPCRFYLGFDGLEKSEFETVFTGFVDSYSWDFKKFTIKVNDPRKKLSNPLPTRSITKSDFANLSDDDVDTFRPIIYGSIRGGKAICVNGAAESPANYTFLIMDTYWYNVTSISGVYVNGVAVSYSSSLSAGTITISASEFEGGPDGVTVDFIGANISNLGEIIQDIMSKYANVQFIPTNYNILEFNRVKSVSRNGAVAIYDTEKLIDTIEKCCIANDSIFLVQDDGKYTLRQYISNKLPRRTIDYSEWIDEPSITIDEKEFLSQVVIKYNRHVEEDTWYKYLNTDYEAEVIRRYKATQSKELNTILVDEEGAIEKSESIMMFSKNIREVVSRSTKTQNIDLEIMDFIIAEPLKRIYGENRLAIYEIIGIQKNLSKMSVKLDMQFVRWYIAPEEVDYQYGILWNHYLWNDKLYQISEES